jgi:hypothetical protein
MVPQPVADARGSDLISTIDPFNEKGPLRGETLDLF